MSESNIQIVKSAFERFLAGDIPGFLDLLADAVHRIQLGTNARHEATTRFAPQHMLNATLAVYRQLSEC